MLTQYTQYESTETKMHFKADFSLLSSATLLKIPFLPKLFPRKLSYRL